MKHRYLFALISLVAVCAFAAGTAFTEDEKPKPMSLGELEGALFQLMSTCPEHEYLKMFVGTWSAKGKAIMSSGEMPVTGTVEHKLIIGGKFVETSYEGPFRTGKFEGRGFLGYNRINKKFEGIWIMTMSTAVDHVEGTYDEKTKTFTMFEDKKMPDGTTWKARQVLVFESPTKMVETHYIKSAGGKEAKTLELTYTKQEQKKEEEKSKGE